VWDILTPKHSPPRHFPGYDYLKRVKTNTISNHNPNPHLEIDIIHKVLLRLSTCIARRGRNVPMPTGKCPVGSSCPDLGLLLHQLGNCQSAHDCHAAVCSVSQYAFMLSDISPTPRIPSLMWSDVKVQRVDAERNYTQNTVVTAPLRRGEALYSVLLLQARVFDASGYRVLGL